MNTALAIFVCPLAFLVASAPAPTPVGTDVQVTVIVPPGTRVAQQAPNADVVVQLASTRPAAGGFEATLHVIPMTAGPHDLRAQLRSPNDAPLNDLQPISVSASTALSPSWRGELAASPISPISHYGGYHLIACAAILAWGLALLPILLLRRRERFDPSEKVIPDEPPRDTSLADLAAVGAALSTRDKQRLEMLLLHRWVTSHDVDQQPLTVALQRLRDAPDLQSDIDQLQTWLHAPSHRSGAVDPTRLLAPYVAEATT